MSQSVVGPFSPIQDQINRFFPPDTHPYRILEHQILANLTPKSYPSGGDRDEVAYLSFDLGLSSDGRYAAKVSVALERFQFQGRSSSRCWKGWSAMRASTSASQA